MNTVAEKNRELALRRKLEGASRESLIDLCIRLEAECEEAYRIRAQAEDGQAEIEADLDSLVAAYEHPFNGDPMRRCDTCDLPPIHPVHTDCEEFYAGGTKDPSHVP